MDEDRFNCTVCGRLCMATNSEEDARKHFQETLGQGMVTESVELIPVCQDCYVRLVALAAERISVRGRTTPN